MSTVRQLIREGIGGVEAWSQGESILRVACSVSSKEDRDEEEAGIEKSHAAQSEGGRMSGDKFQTTKGQIELGAVFSTGRFTLALKFSLKSQCSWTARFYGLVFKDSPYKCE